MKDVYMLLLLAFNVHVPVYNGLVIKNDGGCSTYPLWFVYLNKDVCKECSKFNKCKDDYYCRRCCRADDNDQCSQISEIETIYVPNSIEPWP